MADEIQPTAAEQAEDAEWAQALNEFAPGLSTDTTTVTESTTVETTDTTTAAPETTTTTTVEDTTTTTTVDDGTTTTTTLVPGADTTTTTTVAPDTTTTTTEEPDFSGAEARKAAREAAVSLEEIKADVREKMFKDAPTELTDADGDPIRTIADVMKLNNPQTGQPFKDENEAGTWFLAAQQQFNRNLAAQEKQIDSIAEVSQDLSDQIAIVDYKYGEFLRERTDIRDKLWADFSKSFVKDPKTGIITGMPMSLETFYENSLAPYAKIAEQMENNTAEETRKAAEAQAETTRKAEEARKAAEARDKSDVFGPAGAGDLSTDEEKEWNTAAQDYYGDQLKK